MLETSRVRRVPCLAWLVAPLALLGLAASACGDSPCQAEPEVCDNRDNDCNGLIDDGLQRLCQTACGLGVEVCREGQWVACDARLPEPEICNGLDDDCDGLFDEQDDSGAPLTRACETPCGAGFERCRLGVWQACDAPVPTEEICNGRDDDCDGETDEGLDQDQDGDGHFSLGSCRQPHDDCRDDRADVHPGHPELCDGQDNDCDGQIDEGCPCTPPSSQACGLERGVCRAGTQSCEPGGDWGPCLDGEGLAVVLPGSRAEACNSLDDNCDGQTDEGNPEGGGECGTDEGECRRGTWICTQGELQCRGLHVGPREESEAGCDGLDNDCDGLTDEGLAMDAREPNETCAGAAALPELLEYEVQPAGLTVEGLSLYHADTSPDVDWFYGDAREASRSDPNCVAWPLPDQYFYFRLDLTLPPLALPEDWELCVLQGTCSATTVFCTGPADWQPGAWRYSLGIELRGRCGTLDLLRYHAVVRSAQAQRPVRDCRDYRLDGTFWYCGTSPCP